MDSEQFYPRAFVAGVVGGLGMSAMLAIGRAAGLPAKLEEMLGTMLVAPGAGAFVVGLLVHLTISGLLGLGYGVLFREVFHRANAWLGVGIGLGHAVIAGLVMGMMPAIHPMIPESMPAPGAFMSGMGAMGVAAEFVGHALYGAIVGAIVGAPAFLAQRVERPA